MTAVSPDQQRVGSWYIPYGDTSSQYLHCHSLQDAVTHTAHSSARYVLSLQWKPPQTFSGEVTMLATLVMDYKTYWTNVTSDVLTVLSDEYRDVTEIVDIKVYGGQYDFGDYDYFEEDNSLMESVISTQMLVDFQKRSTEVEDEPMPRLSTTVKEEEVAEARSGTSYKSVLLWPREQRTSTVQSTRRTTARTTSQSPERHFEAWWRLPVTISPTQEADGFNRPTFFADRIGRLTTTTYRSVLMQPRKDNTQTVQKSQDKSIIPSIEPQDKFKSKDTEEVNIPIFISHHNDKKVPSEDLEYQNLIPLFSNIDQNSLETNTVQSVTESFSNLNRLIVTPRNQNDIKKSTYKTSNIKEIDAVFNDKDKAYTKMSAEHGSWDNSRAVLQSYPIIVLLGSQLIINFTYYNFLCQY